MKNDFMTDYDPRVVQICRECTKSECKYGECKRYRTERAKLLQVVGDEADQA